jgi:hypothetical protein
MAKLIDPLKEPSQRLKDERQANGELSAAQIARASPAVPSVPRKGHPAELPGTTLEQRVKADFRVFLTLVWRHFNYPDPSPPMLDMAYWLQHGPDRAIIMAHRGFSKSWITGAYALWRLYCNPDEKVMVVSGGLVRACATSNWCLSLVLTMDILKDLRPKSNSRQSAQMWDVGNCIPAQSASFTAFGIGGQLVGFRGTLIIPDDVETQTNSLTVVMREKIREAVKEFESVLTPGGQIKYLGTPHDVDSLYLNLLGLKNHDGSPVYQGRIWPARYPNEEERRKYNGRLAPYIDAQIKKLGPSCIGHSTMPMRFPDEDLNKREAAMGKTEFRLQFMLDLTGSFIDKFPLKLRDLIVMTLDPKKAPEDLVWGNQKRWPDLPLMGFDGDYLHEPNMVGEFYSPYERTIGYLDGSGRGEDESALVIGSILFGRAFLRRLWASKDGYGPETLKTIAKLCIQLRVSTLYVEANYGDGMLVALLRPVLTGEWEEALRKVRRRDLDGLTGTAIEEVKSGAAQKERRILSVLEPVCQAHRLVIDKAVIEWDFQSIQEMEGEDTRRRYSLMHQFTHLTREKDCLGKDDRLDAVAGLCGMFAEDLEVEPLGMSLRAKDDREEDLLRELEEDELAVVGGRVGASGGRYGHGKPDTRASAGKVTAR